MKRRKLAKRWLVYVALRGLSGVLRLGPLAFVLWLGRVTGRLAAHVDRPGSARARAQLARSLGLQPAEAVAMVREVYAHAGMVAAEIAMLPRLRRRLADYVRLEPGTERVLAEALADGAGRGVVFVSAHLGNWELLAQRVALAGFDATTLARRSPNPFLGRWIARQRALGGVVTIDRGRKGAVREMLSALRRGALLGVLMDQAIRVPSVWVPFFGQPAATPCVAGELAVRRGLPVVVGFIQRGPGGGHSVRLERVRLPDGAHSLALAEGDAEAIQIFAWTRVLTERIEAAIRLQPLEWVWFHDRWRVEGGAGPEGDHPEGAALEDERPESERPEGERLEGDHPEGAGPENERPERWRDSP